MFDKVIELVTASLSLISALAWNSAFQKTIDRYPSLKKSGPWMYAIIITAISVIIITSITQIKKGAKLYFIKNLDSLPKIIYIILALYIFFIIYNSLNKKIDTTNENNKTSTNDNNKTSTDDNNLSKKMYSYFS